MGRVFGRHHIDAEERKGAIENTRVSGQGVKKALPGGLAIV
jgi:hypothetical protein